MLALERAVLRDCVLIKFPESVSFNSRCYSLGTGSELSRKSQKYIPDVLAIVVSASQHK
jgi:hypothetical protein